MEQVAIEALGRTVGRIGFGCSPLGEHGWGDVDREEMMRAIHAALDTGVTLFDVADVYGLGRAEETLGRALAGKRRHAVIVSKFGVKVEPGRGTFYDTSPGWIEAALENSLKRLRTDVIDIYLMHYWDERTPIDVILAALEKAKAAGKIRAYGFTNANPTRMLAGASPPPALAAFSLQYNLLDRHFEGVIQRAVEQHRMTFLSWGSLAEGLLTGKFRDGLSLAADDRRRRYRNFVGERFEENGGFIRTVGELATGLGRSESALALRWILDRIPHSVALVGMKSRQNVLDASDASGWSLPLAVRQRLDSLTAGRRRNDVPGIQYVNSAGADFTADHLDEENLSTRAT